MTNTFTTPDNAPERHKWQTEDGRAVEYIGRPREDYAPIIRISCEYYWLCLNGVANSIDGTDTIRIIDKPQVSVRWYAEGVAGTMFSYDTIEKAESVASRLCHRVWKHTTHPDGSVTMEVVE